MVSRRGSAKARLERRAGFGGVTIRNPLMNQKEMSNSLTKTVIDIC